MKQQIENNEQIRVFIVEDHPVIIEGLETLINMEPNMVICGQADSAKEGLQKIITLRPNVCIIDIILKEGNGIELTEQIKRICPEIPILVLTMHDDNVYAQRALLAGASGYVKKVHAASTVIQAIHQVLEGNVYLSDKTASNIIGHLVGSRSRLPFPSVDCLSNRELQVFEFLGRGLTNPEIAEKCFLSIRTVESYFKRIKDKFDLANTAQLRQFAIQWAKSMLSNY
ncbi:MAG TPA: response regulator transcription factor [Phycisphaerae bacterium]|nr:response regulator transcription factor [Phycisphaerae bacterium]